MKRASKITKEICLKLNGRERKSRRKKLRDSYLFSIEKETLISLPTTKLKEVLDLRRT